MTDILSGVRSIFKYLISTLHKRFVFDLICSWGRLRNLPHIGSIMCTALLSIEEIHCLMEWLSVDAMSSKKTKLYTLH